MTATKLVTPAVYRIPRAPPFCPGCCAEPESPFPEPAPAVGFWSSKVKVGALYVPSCVVAEASRANPRLQSACPFPNRAQETPAETVCTAPLEFVDGDFVTERDCQRPLFYSLSSYSIAAY
jgi:hypothetical protein